MRVAVVGAGLAGLTAARSLARAGHEVVVFEKSRGPGGRMATRRVEPPADGMSADMLRFNHGAQYFTVADPRFATAVDEWERSGIAARWHGRIAMLDSGNVTPIDDQVARYIGVPTMNAIARHLAAGCDVRYHSRIESLGVLAAFDRVVVAVPAPQAVPLLDATTALAGLVASVVMQPCWAVLVTFVSPVAAQDIHARPHGPIPWDAAFVTNSPLGWVARTAAPGGCESWVLHANVEWSTASLEMTADEVMVQLLAAFAAAMARPLPRIRYATAHRWRYARAGTPLDTDALRDADRRVVVCGDWCGGARIESAYLSGIAAAEAALG